ISQTDRPELSRADLSEIVHLLREAMSDLQVTPEIVVAEGDYVHAVFLSSSSIKYVKHTYDPYFPSLSSATTVQSSVTSTSAPILSIHTANNYLYCFWAGSPTADHVYYKKCVGGTWDSSPTDWINEATDHLTANDMLTCFYSSYSYKIGLVYMTKTSSPYNVRFEFLTMPVVPEYPYGLLVILAICVPIYLVARYGWIDRFARSARPSRELAQ
ncbi:MAG: hypothetical protein QXF24_07575, partial [Thermoproteota archaeon]